MIRVLLVDDHHMVRESLSQSLGSQSDMKVVGAACDAETGIAMARSLTPDVVVMDVDMPGLVCFEAARRLLAGGMDLKIVFLSAFFNDRYIEQALACGARGYITKHEPQDTLIKCVRQVAKGGVYYSERILSRIVIDVKGVRLAAEEGTRLSTLTERELEVLRYLASGLAKKEIAGLMHLATKTVDAHAVNIMRKLQIHDRVELSRYAIREGLVEG